MQDLIFVEPTSSMQHEIEAYRNEHFSNGEREIYGGAWMERVSRYSDWLQLVPSWGVAWSLEYLFWLRQLQPLPQAVLVLPRI